jgi:hypothetical protein
MNALVGQKISITSRKAQTTRHRITGIRTRGATQFVFVDTLAPHMIEAEKAANDEPYDKLNPFDIRNARGIFSKAEYAVMNAQAKRLLGRSPTNEITNNQFI